MSGYQRLPPIRLCADRPSPLLMDKNVMIGAVDCDVRPRKINRATNLRNCCVAGVFTLLNRSIAGENDAVTDFGIEGSNTILQLLRIRPPVLRRFYTDPVPDPFLAAITRTART